MTLAFNEKFSHYFECFFPIMNAWLLLQSDDWSLYPVSRSFWTWVASSVRLGYHALLNSNDCVLSVHYI